MQVSILSDSPSKSILHNLKKFILTKSSFQIHKYLKAVEEAKQTLDVSRAIELIREFRLVREHLRTELLNEPEIWGCMLNDMPLMAMMRNLGKMSSIK